METLPEKPSNSDCCGSGCTPCVFDVYEKMVSQYKERVSSTSSRRETRHDLLCPSKYKPFELSAVTTLNKNTALYFFVPMNDDKKHLEGVLPYSPGQHLIIINVKSDGGREFVRSRTGISRAYTPISVSDDTDGCLVQFLIKLYENGRMSSFLSDLRPTDVIYMRGAFGDFKHERNSKYMMICAGTGVAPLYPIIKTILKDEQDETLIHLCWACASFEDLVFREEIREFCKYWNFKATFYLSKETTANVRNAMRYGEDIRVQKISSDVVKEQMSENREHKRILICGSEKFNEDVREYARRCGYEDVHVF